MDPESHALAIGSQMRDVTLRRWLDDAVDKADDGGTWDPKPILPKRHVYPAKRAPAVKLPPMTKASQGRLWRERMKVRMAADPALRLRFLEGQRKRGARKRARRAALLAEAEGKG